MTAPESNTFLKCVRAIRDFVARHIDSSVARESKKASCAALRSNASKNAFVESSKNASREVCGSCTSRALLSLFVASATLLATFVIDPTSALSAGENAGGSTGANTVSTKKVEGAKSDSAKNEGEKKLPQSESDNTEHDKKDTDTSSTLNKDNKESKTVEKPNPAGNNGDDKVKADAPAVKKNVKDAQKKSASTETANNGTDRSTKGEPQLPPECKGKKPEQCYSITYSKDLSIKGTDSEPYTKVPQILTPTIKVAGKKQTTLPNDVWLELKRYGNDDSVNYAFFKGENDKNDSYTAKSTKKVTNSDGSIRFFTSKWLKTGKSYKFNVVIHYPDGSESKAKKIIARLAKDDLPKPKSDDLKLSLYDFENADSTAKKDNDNKSVSITIKPKSKGSAPAGSDDNKDTYDYINKLFIDSQSKDKRGELYHHMICKDDANNYTVDSVNGLSLSNKDGSTTEKQTQFKHMVNEKRPDSGAADSAVYEDDKYTEESQSWISGTPTKSGTFTCKVFAFKDVDYNTSSKKGINTKKHFDDQVKTDKGIKDIFDNPDSFSSFASDDYTYSIDKTNCDYKSVTIEVKSNNPPKPEPPKIGDNDLTLKVYPFKNGDDSLPAELPDKNNKISAILGMSLKPFVDATSAADSKNKIALRVLCSKGEKKKDNAAGGGGASTGGAGSSGSGSAVSGSSGDISSTGLSGANTVDGSPSSAQSGQPSGSSQPADDFEYKTWSSNLAELGLSVPADDNQNTCHSNKEGETTCVSSDPSKKVAARTDKEVSIKPTEVGDYQCVVFALKPKALTEFDRLTGDTTQSGILTPTSISSKLTSAKPTAFKENKDFAAFKLNIQLVSKFTLPHTGGQSWNLQLGILAALLVNLLAAGFVVSQSERGRKLILGRWRGLCNHV
ncbi:hypothetical protein CGSMWGv55152_04790 [Gardnerella vaginalis 55152]|uniref:Uncharacterized protein n=1 Tax=Gardnerella vaginalis 55152 TaxID=698955 RepID=I4LS02_GARVA|nr:hypothetical protein [Gardnerella vaginalis]EIK79742.1 hypothetical protein CGSMWGv55152_04790 [Gardnerella vaginalis 55152]